MINLSKAKTIEYVTFLSKPTISDEALLISAKNTDSVLATINGFIYRYIAKQEDGKWVEVVLWENRTQAKAGLDVFLKHPLSKDFLDKIQEGSVSISYAQVL